MLLVAKWIANADTKALTNLLLKISMFSAAVLSVFCLLTGRIALFFSLVLAAFGILQRLRNPLASPGQNNAPSSGQRSNIQTLYLNMVLDHDTGVLDGVVQKGAYEGESLSSMELFNIIELLIECRKNDANSAKLIETFLDHRYGEVWREDDPDGLSRDNEGASGQMSTTEALDVLGLAEGASIEDIKQAHHRLMLKMHPDKGGSTYLASKINQAKELLLGL